MPSSDQENNCRIIVWVISALIGLLCSFWLKGLIGFYAAVPLLVGVALTVILGLVLTRLFCAGASAEQSGAEPLPQAGSAGNAAVPSTSAPSTSTPSAPAPVTALAEAADAAAKDAGSMSDSGGHADDSDGVKGAGQEGMRPQALSSPRDGQADDLKLIKGVGPKLEQVLNALGFYHFDQIAAWSANEVAWVDTNLMGFKGRVSRDNWVQQAKALASGAQTEFSKRVEDGDVY